MPRPLLDEPNTTPSLLALDSRLVLERVSERYVLQLLRRRTDDFLPLDQPRPLAATDTVINATTPFPPDPTSTITLPNAAPKFVPNAKQHPAIESKRTTEMTKNSPNTASPKRRWSASAHSARRRLHSPSWPQRAHTPTSGRGYRCRTPARRSRGGGSRCWVGWCGRRGRRLGAIGSGFGTPSGGCWRTKWMRMRMRMRKRRERGLLGLLWS